MTVVYGVDLGTTYTKCAVVHGGEVTEVLLDRTGKRPENDSDGLRSAVVATTGGRGEKVAYVGQQALGEDVREREHRLFEEAKIAIGALHRQVDDPPPWPFRPHGWDYLPEDIGALVLRKVKREADLFAAQRGLPPLQQIVLTHPRYFADNRRTATLDAAAIAGIDAVELMTEPDAAAYAYRLHSTPGKYLVFDLGGGTLDLTVASLGRGPMEVITTGGLQRGGRDWDRKLLDRILDEYTSSAPGFDRNCLDRTTKLDWLRKAEDMKWGLTEEEDPDMSRTRMFQCSTDRFQGPPKRVKITRREFEAITQPLVEDCRRTVRQTLDGAGLSFRDIEAVLLVGGSTSLRMVREALKQDSARPVKDNINPNTAVARGAAIYADEVAAPRLRRGVAVPQKAGGIAVSQQPAAGYTPVLSHSLGVLARDGAEQIVYVLAPKDTRLPASIENEFETEIDGQNAIEVKLYEGESRRPEPAGFLGTCTLSGIPSGPAGRKVKVRLDIEANQAKHLSVMAEGRAERKEIVRNPETTLSPEALQAHREFISTIVVK